MVERKGLVTVSETVVDTTLRLLQGFVDRECVVLWLGRRTAVGVEVLNAWRPPQVTESHMFYIPPAAMEELHDRLRRGRLMVAAQVHTHPEEAFHSAADDRWAIVRHQSALSLVLPYFASRVSSQTFFEHTKVFRLSADDTWLEVPQLEVGSWLQVR